MAFPENAADVALLVKAAADTGLGVVAQSTGHGAFFYDSIEDAILIRTTRISDLTITGQTARAGSGALWAEVALEAGAAGLAALHGSSPDVAVGGYLLGGGVGWLSRRHGLACNSVTAVEMVTADGTLRRVDRDNDRDLFWAMRGGGGGYGVVTHVEFDLIPVPTVYAGMLVWDARFGEDLLSAWADWTRAIDEDTTSIIRYLNLPPLPEIPEVLAGKRVITLDSASLGDPSVARSALDDMRSVASPVLDSYATVPTPDLVRLHGDPEMPTAGLAHHTLLSTMNRDVASALHEVLGPDSGNPLLSVEVRHLGGAVAEPDPNGGVLSHIASPYLLGAVGLAMDSDSYRKTGELLTSVVDTVQPWSGGTYLNFSERTEDALPFPDETMRRLAEIKHAYDPNGVFLDRSLMARSRTMS